MWAVAILAVIALLIDLAIHIASFVCVDPLDYTQPEWAWIVGFWAMFLLVVGLANFVDSRRQKQAKLEGRALPTENPLWFKPVIWILSAYILYSVLVVGMMCIRHGEPIRKADGTFAVDPGHGHPVEPISEAEYHRIRRLGVRAGTGFMLGFYVAIVCDLIFTLTGQKRFKPPDGGMRSFSLVLVRRRRLGGD
jgi:hypothetical protein